MMVEVILCVTWCRLLHVKCTSVLPWQPEIRNRSHRTDLDWFTFTLLTQELKSLRNLQLLKQRLTYRITNSRKSEQRHRWQTGSMRTSHWYLLIRLKCTLTWNINFQRPNLSAAKETLLHSCRSEHLHLGAPMHVVWCSWQSTLYFWIGQHSVRIMTSLWWRHSNNCVVFGDLVGLRNIIFFLAK